MVGKFPSVESRKMVSKLIYVGIFFERTVESYSWKVRLDSLQYT